MADKLKIQPPPKNSDLHVLAIVKPCGWSASPTRRQQHASDVLAPRTLRSHRIGELLQILDPSTTCRCSRIAGDGHLQQRHDYDVFVAVSLTSKAIAKLSKVTLTEQVLPATDEHVFGSCSH